MFLFSEIDNLVKNKNLGNLLLSSVYIQIVLIFFVFIGIKGSTSPIKYKNIKEFKKCVYDLKAPILSDHKPYYRLPWITPDNNPILITMMYENYIKDLNFEDTPVYKEVKKGSFETLIIGERNKYNLEKYTLERKCNSLYGAKVKIYIKNQ